MKRVNPEVLGSRRVGRDRAQGRRRGRRRGRARHRRGDALLRHLRRPAAALRRRQRAPAGSLRRRDRRRQARPPAQHVVSFGALDPESSVVVTVSGSSTALPGTEPGAVKVTPFSEYPAKGRATGGVRCHRFLKGEDTLVFAWAGQRARARLGRQRRTGRPPRGHRQARRLRRARQPADRGLRRPARGPRWGQPPVWKADRMLQRHRLAVGRGRRPCSPPSACPRAATTAAASPRTRVPTSTTTATSAPRRSSSWPGRRSTRPAGSA